MRHVVSILQYCVLILQLAFSCTADAQDFTDICSENASRSDCLDYEKRGIDFIICRWQYFFPSLKKLDLLSEKNPIYIFSQSHCEAWLNSEPSNLIPDIEGEYCHNNNEPINPEELFSIDPKRASLCAKYEQAQIYLRAKALKKLAEVKEDFSAAAKGIFYILENFIESEKKFLETKYNQLLSLDYTFPHRVSFSLWSTIKYFFYSFW